MVQGGGSEDFGEPFDMLRAVSLVEPLSRAVRRPMSDVAKGEEGEKIHPSLAWEPILRLV
jgi:hypothetical protein